MAYQPSWEFNSEAILVEGQKWYYLTHNSEDKEIYTFHCGISGEHDSGTGVRTHLLPGHIPRII